MMATVKRIARRLAGIDPLFVIKMHVNQLVIREVAKAVHGSESDDACNAVAEAMERSPVHDEIRDLARSIVDEIERQSGSVPK